MAKRDAPAVAEKCWYAPFPAGPDGRFTPFLPYFWGIWSFSKNKTAAKSLLEFLSDRGSAERQTTATNGYDIPPFQSMSDFKIWETEGPPTGFAYNYPDKPHQKGNLNVAFAPAPAETAVQAYNQAINTKMIARVAQGGQTHGAGDGLGGGRAAQFRPRLSRFVTGRAGKRPARPIPAWERQSHGGRRKPEQGAGGSAEPRRSAACSVSPGAARPSRSSWRCR